MNNHANEGTFTTIILKSGSKEKSIHSYIKKICELMKDFKEIEIKAYGTFIF